MKEFDYRIIQLANNKGTTLVDADSFEELNEYRWYRSSSGYTVRNTRKDESINGIRRTILMHREIMGLPRSGRSSVIDHVNGNKLDNRRSKMRICTNKENQRNRGCCKNSKSMVKGVSWHVRNKKWQATITNEGRKIHIGYYDDIKDAKRARLEAEVRFGWMPVTNKGGHI